MSGGAPDIAVVGGGIVGCALAAFLAEGGASVTLFEREAIAAGASGRNSGVVQHPLDAALVGLYEESLSHYAGLGRGFELPADPAGLLLVAEPERLGPAPAGFPELRPTRLEGAELRAAEPALADGLAAWRLETGRPVPPAAAANAFAARAREAGARIELGAEAHVAPGGVIVGGERRPAGAVALAAGPWTPAAYGGGDLPVQAQWGVVVEFELPGAPTHVMEEAGIEALTSAGGAPPALFSAVTARGISAIGSTFTAERPDAGAVAPVIVEHATRFLPALRGASRRGLRACARPRSHDGRPFLGWLDEPARVAVASGHGAWGITLGPASARLVADLLLGRRPEIPAEFAPGRG
ncbi:MAG TPA: FAD-dependent oxidoreductase [Solirubrobacter sp.]|nr:FAD-dependent oxidoreductase [Solirubrobacter sp.]